MPVLFKTNSFFIPIYVFQTSVKLLKAYIYTLLCPDHFDPLRERGLDEVGIGDMILGTLQIKLPWRKPAFHQLRFPREKA